MSRSFASCPTEQGLGRQKSQLITCLAMTHVRVILCATMHDRWRHGRRRGKPHRPGTTARPSSRRKTSQDVHAIWSRLFHRKCLGH